MHRYFYYPLAIHIMEKHKKISRYCYFEFSATINIIFIFLDEIDNLCSNCEITVKCEQIWREKIFTRQATKLQFRFRLLMIFFFSSEMRWKIIKIKLIFFDAIHRIL